MKREKLLHNLSHIVLIVFIVAQIVLSFVLYNQNGTPVVRNIGYALLWISAILGWLPIITFKKKGEIKKGESFVKTNKLVDTGVYAIVRHPQFLGGMLLAVSLILISQNWIVGLIAIPNIVIFYLAIIDGDREGIKKFGQDYKDYMKKVPRINVVLGLIRFLSKNNK